MILSVQNVSMKFGGLYALNNVSFSVNKGELFSIIGPNGSGKSTMFNVITGVYKPTAGQVSFNDRCVTGKPSYIISQMGMARTFQNPHLYTDLTAIENVMVSLLARSKVPLVLEIFSPNHQKSNFDRVKPIAMEALEITGLGHQAETLAKNLPYGDQKRLEIARCYAVSPDIILMDEPAAGLNSDERELMISLIKELNKKMTIILIEHDMKIVMGISHRIMVLNHGSAIAFGKPNEIAENPEVIKAYLGSEDVYGSDS
ncbi:MAG: ABC transporter ATP-binding protein [Caulobacteraceae bacterium]